MLDILKEAFAVYSLGVLGARTVPSERTHFKVAFPSVVFDNSHPQRCEMMHRCDLICSSLVTLSALHMSQSGVCVSWRNPSLLPIIRLFAVFALEL